MEGIMKRAIVGEVVEAVSVVEVVEVMDMVMIVETVVMAPSQVIVLQMVGTRLCFSFR